MSTKKIIDALVGVLFKKENDRLRAFTLKLVKENYRLGGATDGFIYAGTYYSDLPDSMKSKGKRGSLHHSLEPQMVEYLKDETITNFDKVRIEQALALVLRDARSWQDVRDALPNGLAEMLMETKSLPRTRPEAYTLIGNERAERQYAKIEPLIQIYLASRLMF